MVKSQKPNPPLENLVQMVKSILLLVYNRFAQKDSWDYWFNSVLPCEFNLVKFRKNWVKLGNKPDETKKKTGRHRKTPNQTKEKTGRNWKNPVKNSSQIPDFQGEIPGKTKENPGKSREIPGNPGKNREKPEKPRLEFSSDS